MKKKHSEITRQNQGKSQVFARRVFFGCLKNSDWIVEFFGCNCLEAWAIKFGHFLSLDFQFWSEKATFSQSMNNNEDSRLAQKPSWAFLSDFAASPMVCKTAVFVLAPSSASLCCSIVVKVPSICASWASWRFFRLMACGARTRISICLSFECFKFQRVYISKT